MNTEKIEDLVVTLSKNPFNPVTNFECAREYERLNQTASAVSFYLRAAEYAEEEHTDIIYLSLLKMARCFEDQKDRVHTVLNCFLQAVALKPAYKPAYFLISQYFERQGKWQESYSWAAMGLKQKAVISHQVLEELGYYGDYCLWFEIAVSGWWIGRRKESRKVFLDLLDRKSTRLNSSH